MDQLFRKFKEIKPNISSSYIKRMGILEFQERILQLITKDMPIMDQMNYIQIVCGNIRNFLIERFVEIRRFDEYEKVTKNIKSLVDRIDQILNDRADVYKIRGKIDNKCGCVIVDYLYLTMQQSCYAEETDIEKIRGQLDELEKTNQPCIMITDGKMTADTSRNVVHTFVFPRSFILVNEYVKAFKSVFGSEEKEEKIVFHPDSRIKELKDGSEFLIRVPYDSYDLVTSFIAGICIDPTIESIWITLYRVNPSNSIIVDYLKKAAKSRKHVFVFIEIKAHGDELNNCKIADVM